MHLRAPDAGAPGAGIERDLVAEGEAAMAEGAGHHRADAGKVLGLRGVARCWRVEVQARRSLVPWLRAT
ncbi:hypothetical protein [Belnapia sp. F-4-1]|uniref:hypothetical protein n=1 Tax=Belnapia sp. F-4-1 TaxID=1545443 RepID=UPI001F16558D|nr:hypothetical protein [Belnapia sp. F-4-1]